jgi:hypothetical protein
VSAGSSAVGLPPGLRIKGEPGDRVIRNAMETPVLAEVTTGVWMPLMPCQTWEQWRQLAQAILDTPVPSPEPAPG